MSEGLSSEGGRVPSNRTLPATYPTRRLVCLPPVVDSLYLTCETSVKSEFLSPGQFSTPAGKPQQRQVGNWLVSPVPRSRHFTSYTHKLVGRGLREDIIVVIGPATVAANVPSRRKVRVQIGSSVCWKGACHGHDALGIAREVFRALEGEVLAYLAPENEVKPRRVDTCIDHWGYDWHMSDLNDFVGRPKSRGIIEGRPDEQPDEDQTSQHSCIVSPTGATYYLGKRNAASRLLRIYQKLMEAAASGKLPWMEPIWLQAGWDGVTPIWRVEIEHGSEWLAQHGFTSMLDLAGCERELWAHYAQGVRHTCGDNTRLRNRPTSPVWEAITAAAMTRSPGTWKWHPRKPNARKDVSALIKQAVGCISSAMTYLGEVPWHSDEVKEVRAKEEVVAMVLREIGVSVSDLLALEQWGHLSKDFLHS